MVELSDIRKRFGSVRAVDGLSLRVERGEVLGLLGPNGAGKTTSLAIATGLVRPDSGKVSLHTHLGTGDPAHAAHRRFIGVAPQALSLYDELTGAQNLAFFGRLYGLGGARLRARVEACLAMAGLSDRAGHRAGGYSGGMKRRLNLAAALLHEPPLLMLDEPTAGVDAQSRAEIFRLVESQKLAGRTVIYSTHYLEEAERLCDRVAIMDHGRLLALDTVPALLAGHGGPSTVHIETDAGHESVATDDPVGELTRRVNAAGGPSKVRSARIEAPTLEDVFLNLTGRTLRN